MKAVLVPSAALIPREMRKRFGEIPPVLYPLNGMPLIEHLYKQYASKTGLFIIVVYKKAELVRDYVRTRQLNIRIIELDELKDLGYTIQKGLEAAAEKEGIDGVYLNFADTLVYDACDEPKGNYGYYSEELLNDTWTFYERDGNGGISTIYDKQDISEKDSLRRLPFFVGSFYFKEWRLLFEKLNCTPKGGGQSIDSFYRALQSFSGEARIEYRKAEEWFDVGHDENYLKARTGVQARAFNTIEIDESRGLLKKTSENKDKFINEIKWYVKLPNRLQYLIPRIYEYSVSREAPYVLMEYYGYNTLHELFLYGNLPLHKWHSIFEKLRFVIDDMESYTVRSSKDTRESLKSIYTGKTLTRLETLRNQEAFSGFFHNPITINGEGYLPLECYMDLLPKAVEKELLPEEKYRFAIVHGDLCFSNILMEENHGFVRVIDPRGEFGAFDLYGDTRYEIAKLLHSIEGKYDYIIEDMFELSVDGEKITYQVHSKTEAVLDIFRDVFRNYLTDYPTLQLIESTLFLSMIPLHSDHPRRQYAMLATGIGLLDKVLKERGYI